MFSMNTWWGTHLPPHLSQAVPFSAIPSAFQESAAASLLSTKPTTIKNPLKHFAQAGPWNVQFFSPRICPIVGVSYRRLPLKECFVWDKVLAETCLITCQLTFWYALMRLLGCHSIRSRRAEMAGSSSSSPWRLLGSLAVFLLTRSLETPAFYFNF